MRKCSLSDVMFYSMDGLNSTYVIIRLELDKTIDKNKMSEAFKKSCKRFPYFQTKLQKLDSGFTLVLNEHIAKMHEDSLDYVINASENDEYLYRFSISENIITFSFFHGLTDESQAIAFIKVILNEYYAMLNETIVGPKDIYDINAEPDVEETAEPLDYIPMDVLGGKKIDNNFYKIPGKNNKDAVAYTFSASSDRVMKYASSFDGSPNAVAAIVMAKAISEVYPDSINSGIDVDIAINAKPIIGIPKSHWPLLQTSTFHFNQRTMEMDEEMLHACVRGKVFADCTEEKLFKALSGVRSLGSIFEYVKDDKARKLLCLKSTQSQRATATISYAGATDFGSIGKHIKGFYSFCDAASPILEINYNDGVFYFSMSSHVDCKLLVEKIREVFNTMDFQCSEIKCVNFNLKEKNKLKFGLNLATLNLILGLRAYKHHK